MQWSNNVCIILRKNNCDLRGQACNLSRKRPKHACLLEFQATEEALPRVVMCAQLRLFMRMCTNLFVSSRCWHHLTSLLPPCCSSGLGKELDDDEIKEAMRILDTSKNGYVEFGE